MSASISTLLQPILIAGPTASGKSALAMSIAERVGGLIINADSMQIYRELRILTARPSDDDEARIAHRLYGIVPASDAYSVGRYVADVEAVLAEAVTLNLRPIIVGGTGLYFKALLDGLSPIPPIPPDVRLHWRLRGEVVGAAGLWPLLQARDPAMAARLAANDTQRIVRALEVIDATGRSLASWQAEPGRAVIDPTRAVCIALAPEPGVLKARAEQRLDAMIGAGGVEEASQIASLGLDTALPAMRAIGVAPFARASRGEVTVAAALDQAKAETRQYIKRQSTWMRRHMIAWNSISAQEAEIKLARSLAFIRY